MNILNRSGAIKKKKLSLSSFGSQVSNADAQGGTISQSRFCIELEEDHVSLPPSNASTEIDRHKYQH